jgi:hypothetical protein
VSGRAGHALPAARCAARSGDGACPSGRHLFGRKRRGLTGSVLQGTPRRPPSRDLDRDGARSTLRSTWIARAEPAFPFARSDAPTTRGLRPPPNAVAESYPSSSRERSTQVDRAKRVAARSLVTHGGHRMDRCEGCERSWRRRFARSKRLAAVSRGAQRVSAWRRRRECSHPTGATDQTSTPPAPQTEAARSR